MKMKMKKCAICENEITHVITNENKLIGIFSTPDGYICNDCIKASEEAGVLEFANDSDGSITSRIIKE